MKFRYFLFLMFTTPLFGIQIQDVIFTRVFSGSLKEEEDFLVRAFLYAYRGIPADVLKTDNVEKRFRLFFVEESIDLNNPDKEIYVIRAEYNNELIGYVSFEHYGAPDTVYIRELGVDPSVMQCGLGRKLVFICKEYIPCVRRIILATTVYNKNAREFYKHVGFTESADVPHDLDPSMFVGLEYLVSL